MNNYPFEPGRQPPQGPYQPSDPYTPSQPQPPSYQPGNPYTPSQPQPPAYQPPGPYTPSQPPVYQPANPYAPPPPAYPSTDPYNPARPPTYPPTDPYAPPPAPLYQSANPYAPPPVQPQIKRNRIPLIVAIIAALVIVGSIGVFAIRGATGTAPTPTAIPIHYPAAASAYSGSVHNLSFNQDANMALTSVVQDQDKINGDIKFGLPLIGSGTFTGTVSSKGAVRFTVNSRDNGSVTLTFTGTLVAHGPMQGTYTVSNGQHGTWKAEPATTPVVYPVLSQKYAGTYHNNSTGKDGAITLEVITQDQKNFTGTFLRLDPVNGSVGSDNSIQFAISDGKGGQIKFNGTVNIDGSLSGTYIAPGGVTGTWKLSPPTP